MEASSSRDLGNTMHENEKKLASTLCRVQNGEMKKEEA